MKPLILFSLTLSTFLAAAPPVVVKVKREAFAVRVDSVKTKSVSLNGGRGTKVLVTATFGNPCSVPKSEELVKVVLSAYDDDALVISLGNEQNRMCPTHYLPTEAVLDVGTFTKPADGGLYREVTVNGVSNSN